MKPVPGIVNHPARRGSGLRRLLSRFRLGLHRDARFLLWGMFFWDFGFGLYNAFLTLYIRSLGASDFQIGLLIAVQGLVRIGVTIPSGILADAFDRRRLIVLTTATTVPAALIYWGAQAWWQLLPGMMLFMVANMGTAALSSYIADVATGRDRARAFALIYTVGPAAALILAPTIGGWVAEAVSLRSIFLVSAASYLVATIIMSRITTRPMMVHHDVAPSYREAMSIPAVRAVSLLSMVVVGTCMFGVTFLPNYLEDVRGFSLSTIGRLFSISAIGSVAMSLMLGRVRRIDGSRGIAIGVLGVGLACAVTLGTSDLWLIGPAFLGRGGFMVAWSLFPAVLGEVTPDRLRARAFASADFLGGIGLVIAPFAAGALYGQWAALPLLVFVLLAPPIALATLWVDRRWVRPAIGQRQMMVGGASPERLAEGPA